MHTFFIFYFLYFTVMLYTHSLVLLFISTTFETLCPNMLSGEDTWYCVPCSGLYTCQINRNSDDFCYVTSTGVSCTLPTTTTQ
jgi:hypothetical protein